MPLLAPHNGPKHAKFFTVLFYGVRNSYCKNAQFCAMQRESEMTELPSVGNRVQRSENKRKNSFLNYKSVALSS